MTYDCAKIIPAFLRETSIFPQLVFTLSPLLLEQGLFWTGAVASLFQQFSRVFGDAWDVPSWGSWFVHLCAAQERS